jgi:hypothetical protein
MAQGNQEKLHLPAMRNYQFHLRPEMPKVRRRAQLQLCSKTQAGNRTVFKEQVMQNKAPNRISALSGHFRLALCWEIKDNEQ